MATPQEIEVWYILPALRREIAMALKEQGYRQHEVARMLGLTEPAVSQYIKNKRAQGIELGPEISRMARQAAENVAKDLSCHRYELQKLISAVKKSGLLCRVHRSHDDVPGCCNVCIGEKKCESI